MPVHYMFYAIFTRHKYAVLGKALTWHKSHVSRINLGWRITFPARRHPWGLSWDERRYSAWTIFLWKKKIHGPVSGKFRHATSRLRGRPAAARSRRSEERCHLLRAHVPSLSKLLPLHFFLAPREVVPESSISRWWNRSADTDLTEISSENILLIWQKRRDCTCTAPQASEHTWFTQI
jgi:hypothetical protein